MYISGLQETSEARSEILLRSFGCRVFREVLLPCHGRMAGAAVSINALAKKGFDGCLRQC